MTEHFTHEHVREHAHIGTTIITSTDGDSISVTAVNAINQLSLGLKKLA